MARDKTDKTDKSPPATLATTATRGATSRAEIEAALDDVARKWLGGFGRKRAIPGWNILFDMGVEFIQIDRLRIPALTEAKAAQLVKLAENNAPAFDALTYIAGLHVMAEEMLEHGIDDLRGKFPHSLRFFAGRVLMGEIKRPAQPGRPRVDDVPLRAAQYGLCRFVSERAPLPLSRNRAPSGPIGFSACDAVAEAFTRAGRHTTQAQLASLCYDAAHADIRALAEALDLLDFSEIE